MEKLAEALGDAIAEPPDDPLAPECILVPGRGVAQWLSLQLCERFGVSANVLYLYPRNFVGWALERVLARPGESLSAFDPERLLWSIFGTLSPLLELPEFAGIQRYVAGDPTRVRYFELCRRIASTFDRYITYRPDLLKTWERRTASASRDGQVAQLGLFSGPPDAQSWQPILWRALVERLGPAHTGALERRFLTQLERAKKLDNLPSRISCIGITHLPPSYTRILVALGAHLPIDLFHLQPTVLMGPGGAREGAGAGSPNPLVRSLATLALDFEHVLADELDKQRVTAHGMALHVEPERRTRLHQLQRDILHDRARGGGPRGDAPTPGDDSIRIHVCHSPMREIEVVHDQLMSLLSSGAGIEPRDVVVMMPDIEVYAPLIEAVFRRREGDAHRIPYSIADRSVRTSAPVVDALGRVLSLVFERLSAPQLLDLLALDVVASHFEITPKDVERMTEWLTGANVRWGKDALHRETHGHPRSDANTWRLGLRRLLLGYAVESDGTELLCGTLPESTSLGTEAAALGKLARFVETLFAVLDALAVPQCAAGWARTIGSALDALTVNDERTAWQHQEVRDALTALTARAEAAGYAEVISAPAFGELLFDSINAARPARGFLMGGVTFCSMVPLRTVPFKVVCLTGLGDREFPRREAVTDFDLISLSSERRVGDRSRRVEDRYVFLEALLSARERLLITYVGQSIRDNSLVPPSVLVSDLCDYLGTDVTAALRSAEASSALVVRHPLQAFSPRYFDGSDPRLFSYAATYLEGARTREQASLSDPPPFFDQPLPDLPRSAALAISDLIRFYQNPTEFLLNHRLELYLRERDVEVQSREPQELSPLDRYAVGQRLLELMLRDVPIEVAKRAIMASGALPLGSPGELDFLEVAASARPIAERTRAARRAERRPPSSLGRRLPSGVELVGLLPESFGGSIVDCQFARARAKHLLSLWIRHLLHCWHLPALAQPSSLFARPAEGEGVLEFQLRVAAEPQAVLQSLVERFHDGQRAPLHFFPSASQRYAELLSSGKPEAEAVLGAQKLWVRDCLPEPHIARVFGGVRTLTELREHAAGAPGFEQLAREIMDPLLEHLSVREPGA